eukprot:g467.t1
MLQQKAKLPSDGIRAPFISTFSRPSRWSSISRSFQFRLNYKYTIRVPKRNLICCTYPEPETEKERSPLDYPQEWVTPQPSRRPDIFPEFEKLETPLPKPLPGDPEQPDEEEEIEKGKEKPKPEPEEDPEKEKEEEEDPDQPQLPDP